MKRLTLLLVVFLANFNNILAQSFTIDNNAVQLSLITCDPGDELYSIFGHSAVRLRMPNQDMIFNYGTFDFNTPGFAIKFMRGKLLYKLVVNNYSDFLREYQFDKRGVREQTFNVSLTQKNAIVDFLINNAKPENAEYKYDFFFDNCSTRIRDLLNQNVEKIEYPTYENSITYRNILHQYLQETPWLKLGIDLIIGSIADKNANVKEQMFIPDYLHNNLGNSFVGVEPILDESKTVLEFTDKNSSNILIKWLQPNVIILLLMLLMIATSFFDRMVLFNWLRNAIYLLLGVAGLLITFLWFGTDHLATKSNFNLVWISPFVLLLFYFKGQSRIKMLILLFLLTLSCLLGMTFNIIPQQHPSIMLSVLAMTLFGLDLRATKRNIEFKN